MKSQIAFVGIICGTNVKWYLFHVNPSRNAIKEAILLVAQWFKVGAWASTWISVIATEVNWICWMSATCSPKQLLSHMSCMHYMIIFQCKFQNRVYGLHACLHDFGLWQAKIVGVRQLIKRSIGNLRLSNQLQWKNYCIVQFFGTDFSLGVVNFTQGTFISSHLSFLDLERSATKLINLLSQLRYLAFVVVNGQHAIPTEKPPTVHFWIAIVRLKLRVKPHGEFDGLALPLKFIEVAVAGSVVNGRFFGNELATLVNESSYLRTMCVMGLSQHKMHKWRRSYVIALF